jgi:signal transduction histidine kinase
MNRKKHGKIFLGFLKFALFFMLISFVVTCSFLLFLKTMDGADFAREDIHISAKLTLLNIVFLTILFCVIDTIRRKLTVERNMKNIIKGLDRITKGDFDVKIDIPHDIASENEFDVIAEQINVMTAELKGVETLRTDFIANVSHELKTPLAAINNYGALLQSPDISADERVKYAKAITDNSRSLANRITNILKLNKLENQQIFPEVKPYNLSEQLCECLLGFEDVWERKKLEIDTDIEEDVTVTADSELLSLVWNNLFSNAVKFTDSGGSIFVGLKSENGFAVVTVTDTGCGMSAETGRHIFEKFYQGDTSHAIKGNGLGLALVKRVADITGGEISVQSEVGKGSTFTVKLRE